MTFAPMQIARSGPRLPALSEVGIVMAAYFAYFLVRGATEGDFSQAVEHAELIRRFEGSLGLFVEPQLQAAVLDTGWIVDVANWVYVWGHWPVIAGVAVWLYRSHHERYRLVRNAMLISGAIGLVIFTTFPVAPPRLADMGLVDTVVQRSDFYRVLQPPALTNQYAAVPSLHFGWNLLIGIAVFQSSTRLSGRIAGVLSPIAMFAAVVLTGNHYIIDTVVGGTVALVGLRGAYVLRDAATLERRALRSVPSRLAVALRTGRALPIPAFSLVPVELPRSAASQVATSPVAAPVAAVEGSRPARGTSGCAPGMPCGPAARPQLGRGIEQSAAATLRFPPAFIPPAAVSAPKVSERAAVARSRAIQDRDSKALPRVETLPLTGAEPKHTAPTTEAAGQSSRGSAAGVPEPPGGSR